MMLPHRGTRAALFAAVDDAEPRLARVIWSTSQRLIGSILRTTR
jgi:hypothetical protein